MNKSIAYVALVAVSFVLSSCASGPANMVAGNGDSRQVKNVIFLLSDGTANEAWPLTRRVKGTRLASDDILSGAIRTYGADSIIPDSASGATSYATGQKGTYRGIAVYPWNVTIEGVAFDPAMQCVPLATVLEGARLTGRATGIVATSNVQHVNRSGHILAHPNLEAIADLPAHDRLDELAALMNNPGVDTVAMTDPISHKKSWIVESPVDSLSLAHGGEDWSLIVSWPIEKRMAPLNGMMRRLLVLYLFLGGAAIWFLNRIFDDTITRPLRMLAEQAHNYAEGNFSQPAAPLNEALELHELGQALNALGATLKKTDRSTDTTDSP